MGSKYKRGSDFERRVMKDLRGQGFRLHRTAGSHTPIDIMSGADGQSFAIQCQIDEYFLPSKIEALKDEAKAFGARPYLCWRGDKSKQYPIMWKEVE